MRFVASQPRAFNHENLKEELSQSLSMLVGLRKSWASRPLTVRENTVE